MTNFQDRWPDPSSKQLVPKINKSFLRVLLLTLLGGLSALYALPSHAHGEHEFHFEVSRGDVFYKFFFGVGLKGELLSKMMKADERATRLSRIAPGDKFKIILDDNHGLKKIVFQPLNANPLLITYNKQKFRFVSVNIQSTEPLTHSTIVISKSLNYDGKKAGIEPEVIDLIITNFTWVMDFSRDLQKGDKFILAWSGDKTPSAMIYVGARKTIALFAYTSSASGKSYHDINGKTLNDTFEFSALKKYDRISSRFTKSRWHPVLKKYRSHKGTDFAAPKGRPVYATAKGTVKHVAVVRGYGNVVYLSHGTEVVTLYAHLSKFAKGLKTSQKIKKGQLVGYVGSTGLATGPHLHYEIRINGVHQDAEKVSLPRQLSIPANTLSVFKSKAKSLLAQLGIK
ncbi:MAG: peptidoglycan DD-metalloendopeptidase family protein [Gammaproteobacteria bacterium]